MIQIGFLAAFVYLVGIPIVYERLVLFTYSVEERRDVLHLSLCWPFVFAIGLFDLLEDE